MRQSTGGKVLASDLAGVLAQTSGYHQLQKLIGADLTDQEVRELWMNSDAVKLFEAGKIGSAEFGLLAVEEFGIELSSEAFIKAYFTWQHGFYPGAEDLTASLSRRFAVCRISNNNEIRWNTSYEIVFQRCFASHKLGSVRAKSRFFLTSFPMSLMRTRMMSISLMTLF
ncbi:hypothetical protein [Ralstonia edaphi]|uniref:hypothetical protein n=1 Tax=Ralstonia edaphi TaxID=3058599 RepID=UPI00292D8091|nr:hypothetical protein [Ralstonia sp. LMG 6871]